MAAPAHLSVILPVRNEARLLPEQLEALSRQVCDSPWEVIVSDNGSTDDTVAVAERFASRLPGLRIVHATARAGCGHARNAAAPVARGDAFAYCDGDDVVCPGWVAAMARALGEHALVAGALNIREINPPEIARLHPWFLPLEHGLGPSDFRPWGAGANLGVRRELFDRLGGFDEGLVRHQDVDFCWRAAELGHAVVFVPDSRVHYRLRGSRRTMYRQARAHAEYYPALLRRHGPKGLKVPRPDWRHVIKLWGFPGLLLRDLPRAWGDETRMNDWTRRFAQRVGSLRGTIRFRTPFYL